MIILYCQPTMINNYSFKVYY